MSYQFSSVQSLNCVQFFATPWIAARRASLSITNSWNSFKLMSIESVMPSSHLILCHPLLLLPPIPPSITVFSNESTLRVRWPKYWSFSCSIIPSKEHPGVISFRMDWLDLFAVQGTLKSPPTPQFKSINSSVLSFLHSPTLTSIHDHFVPLDHQLLRPVQAQNGLDQSGFSSVKKVMPDSVSRRAPTWSIHISSVTKEGEYLD